MSGTHETWCQRDEHSQFECFIDFNDWLDSDGDYFSKDVEIKGAMYEGLLAKTAT
jgi:hypothetical protein